MTIYFSNPGTFDIRLLSTFGVNAKPQSTNPIGHFGTGLKYAVAGVLRLGGTISIHTQDEDGKAVEWTVYAKETEFRGTTHQMCYLLAGDDVVADQLPFSTALGAHWEPWMLYREFKCNMLDEGGKEASLTYPAAAEGPQVVFCVSCPEVEACLATEANHFNQAKALATIGDVEILPANEGAVYYKGVKVFTFPKKTLYSYNFLSGLTLTEDRTVPEYLVRYSLVRNFFKVQAPEAHFLHQSLEAPASVMESGLDYDHWFDASETFKQVVASAYRKGINDSARKWAKDHIEDQLGFLTTPWPEGHLQQVEDGLRRLAWLTKEDWSPLFLLSEEAEPAPGISEHKGTFYLHPEAFSSQEMLFRCLVEGRFKSHLKTQELCSILLRITQEHQEEVDSFQPIPPLDADPEVPAIEGIPF